VGVYEDTDPSAKGAVRVVHRSCEALPSTYSYHSTNNYSSYAASPRVRRTGRGRGEAAASPSRRSYAARVRELDVELRELSGEAEVDEVECVPTQFGGENEEQEEQEIDESGIFFAEEFVPARSSMPPPSSPSRSSAAYSPNGSSSSPQRTAIAAALSRRGRIAGVRGRPGRCRCLCLRLRRERRCRGLRALTPPTPALAAFALCYTLLAPPRPAPRAA
jgi:hypothetical protein